MEELHVLYFPLDRSLLCSGNSKVDTTAEMPMYWLDRRPHYLLPPTVA